MTPPASMLGIRCTLHPLTGGLVYVRPRTRGGRGGKAAGTFFSTSGGFQVAGSSRTTTIVCPHVSEAEAGGAVVDTRQPWQPTVFVSAAPDIVPDNATLPRTVAGTAYYYVSAQPDLAYYIPTYGVDHVFYLVVVVDGLEVAALAVPAGTSGSVACTLAISAPGATVLSSAVLFEDSSRAVVVATSTYVYTQPL